MKILILSCECANHRKLLWLFSTNINYEKVLTSRNMGSVAHLLTVFNSLQNYKYNTQGTKVQCVFFHVFENRKYNEMGNCG